MKLISVSRTKFVQKLNNTLEKIVYLDNNATTKVDTRVLEAMMPFLTDQFANASSTHLFGVHAYEAVKSARAQVSTLIGAEPHESVFTSGSNEAINLANNGGNENYQSKAIQIVKVSSFRIMKYTLLFLIIAILTLSCEHSNVPKITKQQPESTDQIDNIEEKKDYPYLTNSQVESLIKSKDPNFMSSIWIGMTETESYEILRYLIEKQLIFGDIYNSQTGKREPVSRYNIKDPAFKGNSRNLFCYLTPNIKKIHCTLDLEFNQIGPKFLKSISVSIFQEITIEDFDDFIKFYTYKYGVPVAKSNKKPNIPNVTIGEVYRRYSFEKENKLVDITFESSHTNSFPLGTTPNQIHIKYEDKTIKNQELEKLKERIRQDQQRIMDERNESYKNI